MNKHQKDLLRHEAFLHGLDAAGGGDADTVDGGEVIGPCPSCGADLCAVRAENPHTGRVERALMHPAPFCTYYGETHPDAIERAIERAREKGALA